MLKKFFTVAVMLAAMVVSSTAFALNQANIADGVYSIQPQCAPGKELSVQNHATNWGANVIIDNISPNWRKWKVQKIAGTNFYSIIAVHSNLALDVDKARTENGVSIATWPFTDANQSRYIIWDAGGGYYVIQSNIGGSFVLDVAGGENRAGVPVHSWSFNNTPAQLWKLVPVQRLSPFQSFSKTATQTVNAYVMPDLSSRTGNERVDRGDNVTVLREEGNAYLVRYPVSGGTKTRWVNKNEIFSGPTPSPTPAPSGDYDRKVTIFKSSANYRHGAKASDCFAYASKFTNYVFGKAPRQGQVFYSANDIRAGDVVHVNATSTKKQHWIVVLYRNGNQLETIEGGWTNGTVRHSTSAYWIQDGVIYSNNEKPFRNWDCGYHFQ